jgi:hypothetical protein
VIADFLVTTIAAAADSRAVLACAVCAVWWESWCVFVFACAVMLC